jgi:hypothetical protein
VVYLYSFFNLGAVWGGWLTPRPVRFNPEKETRYQFYTMVFGPQVWSGRVGKNRVPIVFQIPDRLGSSESLYQLRYSGRFELMYSTLYE